MSFILPGFLRTTHSALNAFLAVDCRIAASPALWLCVCSEDCWRGSARPGDAVLRSCQQRAEYHSCLEAGSVLPVLSYLQLT